MSSAQHLPSSLALLFACLPILGCGEFGLPSDAGDGDLDRGEPAILFIEPNVASQGTLGLQVQVYGIDTLFDETAEVFLPNLPDVDVVEVSAVGVESLILELDVPSNTPLGSSPLVVRTERDGDLVLEDGFFVVH